MIKHYLMLAGTICLCIALTATIFWVSFVRGSDSKEPPIVDVKTDDSIEIDDTKELDESTNDVDPIVEEIVEEAVEPEVRSLGTFKLTAYCACPKCCGEWADGITYTGTKATPNRTIAVDPSIIPLGSTVYVNDQAYVAEDIGGAIKGNRIDVYFPSHIEALHFGVQYAEVTMLNDNS